MKTRISIPFTLFLFVIASHVIFGQQPSYLKASFNLNEFVEDKIGIDMFINDEYSNQLLKLLNSEKETALERPSKVEFAAWYGLTFTDVENQNGIRRLDFKYQPNKENLLFVFYDNALALDNNTIANFERTSSMVGIGAKHDWTDKWFTKLEGGRRFLTTQEDQHLINIENGYFFSWEFLGKLITQYDNRQDDELLTLGLFVDIEILEKFRLETGVFHAENLTISETYNQRYMVIPKFRLGKTELVFGGYYDRYRTPDVSLNQLSGGYSLFIFPIYEHLKGNFFFNYDKGFMKEITVVSFGLNQKI